MSDHGDTGVPSYGAPPRPEQPPEEAARLGPFQRLTGVLFSPGETFADVNRKPTYIAPIIIGMVLALAASVVFSMRVKVDWERITRDRIRTAVEKTGGSMPPEEQIQQQVNITKMIGKVFPVIAVIGTPIYYAILAGIFALALMIAQTQTTFKKILSVVSWSAASTSLVGTIVTSASLMVRDTEGIDPSKPESISTTNLAAFLPSGTARPLSALAASLDVFTIWFLILLTIGFAAIAGSRRVTTGKTGSIVFGLWILWVLIKVGFAALGFGG